MATTYLELAAQIEKLQSQAASLKSKERPQVIAQIKAAIAAYDLTAQDLGLTGKTKAEKPGKRAAKGTGIKRGAGKKAKAAPSIKFRDDNGNTWSGRGPRPGWLKTALEGGAKLESFAA
jgi:DNA-binding protein H-NS